MYKTDLYKLDDAICKKCHDMDVIYCEFCFCPMYYIRDCGGKYEILNGGVKDCSDCLIPHTKQFVDDLLKEE